MALVEDMFRRFMARQSHFINNLTEDQRQKLADMENKYAELRVTGPEGGTMYFLYKGQHLQMLDGPPVIPYERLDRILIDGDLMNYDSGDEVLFDILDGSLSPRAAKSREYFRANTDKIIYDSEEFIQIFEQFLNEMRLVIGGSGAH